MSARLILATGDVLKETADVLICTANTQLNMSGGVNGELLARGGAAIQAELHAYLKANEKPFVAPGTVVETSPGPLAVTRILHAVAVDAFYQASVESVAHVLQTCLAMAAKHGAKTVVTPALATGYGPLTMVDFAHALALAVAEVPAPIAEIRVVLWRESDAAIVRESLAAHAMNAMPRQSKNRGDL